jgi:hypothetical protein
MEATKEKHATFTPGPWEKATIGIGTNSKQVVWLGENTGKQVQVIGTGRDHANARLIAAAPEMYDVLSELFDTLGLSRGYGFDEEYDKIREVLAKVDGGEG